MGKSYFQGGKGNAIVLQLVGTCVLFDVKKGIIISSESKESLKKEKKKKLNEIIAEIAKTKEAIQIETIFMEEIKEMLKDDNVRKAFIIEHFNSVMPKTYPAGISYRIPCTCGHEFTGETRRSLRIKIYEQRRLVRAKNMNSDIYKHIKETEHKIDWDNTKFGKLSNNQSKKLKY